MLYIFFLFYGHLLCTAAHDGLHQQQLNDALCIAAENGRDQEIKQLLASSADANALAAAFGQSALHVAAAAGHVSSVKLLLQRADPARLSHFDETPVHTALAYVGNNYEQVVLIIQALLNAGTPVAPKELLKGNTGLHLVAKDYFMPNRYALHILKMLLDAGACKEEKNNKGITPIEKTTVLSRRFKKDDFEKSHMLAARAAFMRIYPPINELEERIVSTVLRVHALDPEIAKAAREEIEALELHDMLTYHIFEPYLRDCR